VADLEEAVGDGGWSRRPESKSNRLRCHSSTPLDKLVSQTARLDEPD
jgi:hypothetical protein